MGAMVISILIVNKRSPMAQRIVMNFRNIKFDVKVCINMKHNFHIIFLLYLPLSHSLNIYIEKKNIFNFFIHLIYFIVINSVLDQYKIL